jgi:hypothetical protein
MTELQSKDIPKIIAEWGNFVKDTFKYTDLSREEYIKFYQDYFKDRQKSLKNLVAFHERCGFDCQAYSETLVKIFTTMGIEANKVTLFSFDGGNKHAVVEINPYGYIEPQTGNIFSTKQGLVEFYSRQLDIPPNQFTIYSPQQNSSNGEK